MSTIYPFESFFDKLIKLKVFRDEIKYHYGEIDGARIIKQIREGTSPDAIEGFYWDDIENSITEYGNTAHSLTGLGGYGNFPIEIKRWGPLFWIWAPEFDEIRYFKSLKEAKVTAKNDFEPYITAYKEEVNRDAD